jgi:tetratricopeptide (TPR) repeat protein
MRSGDSSRALAIQLEKYLIERKIRSGMEAVRAILDKGPFLPASLESGIPLLFCITQWIDLGFNSDLSIDDLLGSLADSERGVMPMNDFLQLRMVEAFACMRKEDFSGAILLLRTATELGSGVLSPYGNFVAHFWLGRAQRLAGNFEESLDLFRKARAIALRMRAAKLVAVTKIHESWLVFHKGDMQEALLLLDESEKELLPTGHALSLGNISAARGRFVRSSGQYAEALEHFTRAIKIYSPDFADHPNLARSLVNAAYVKRLMALELQPKTRGAAASAATHKRSLAHAKEALGLLHRAGEIYKHQRHQGGTGAVLVNTGYLQLESGDIEQAAATALEAYVLGESKMDEVLMARANILQAFVELASCEEQLEDEPDAPSHSSLAAKYADQAVDLASRTQNRRLLAAAYIIRGLVAADDAHQDWLLARSYAAKAKALLGEKDRDHLWRELLTLNQKISRSTAVDEIIKAWCDGELGGRTFQQVQDEFAEIVIPKAWVKLDRKVSRVAHELSISPKKVRRILRASRHI